MPLLKRKRIPLAPVPKDITDPDTQVYYINLTHEIFTSYEDYLAKITLYKERVWQCETTGRSGLTYAEALASEKMEREKVEDAFPEALKKGVLELTQFGTGNLNGLVDLVINHYKEIFVEGEQVNILWDDGVQYSGRIISVIPQSPSSFIYNNTPSMPVPSTYSHPPSRPKSKIKARPPQNGYTTNGIELSLSSTSISPQNNNSNAVTSNNDSASQSDLESAPPIRKSHMSSPTSLRVLQSPNQTRYKVQLLDDEGELMDDYIKVVMACELSRDRLTWSKTIVKKFIRESMTKESWMGAPWVVKPSIARRYGISSTLPNDITIQRDLALGKARKRAPKSAEEKEAERRAKLEEREREKEKRHDNEEELLTSNKKSKEKKPLIKYPIEDLELPIQYPPEPESSELSEQSQDEDGDILMQSLLHNRPKKLRGVRPRPSAEFTLPTSQFEILIMVWNFLIVFGKPLQLSPFILDDFECALRHSVTTPRCVMMNEIIASLCGVIIKDFKAGVLVPASVKTTKSHTIDVLIKEEQDDMLSDTASHEGAEGSTSMAERGGIAMNATLIRPELLKIATSWETGIKDGRCWECVVVGIMLDFATSAMVPNLHDILVQLVPVGKTVTSEEVERNMVTLNVADKLVILEFLIGLCNSSSPVKEFMEQCQEELTELRKIRNEVGRERKRVQEAKKEVDRRENGDKGDETAEPDGGTETDEETHERENTVTPSVSAMTDDDSDDIHATQARFDKESRHQSRQAQLRHRAIMREALELRRAQEYERERELARQRGKEAKAVAAERRKLEDEEIKITKKEDQIARDMRRYSTLRIKPLGRDRFYNRYYYFDGIGCQMPYTTGRLYVQSPSELDMALLRAEDPDTTYTKKQIWERMNAEGFMDEANELDKHGSWWRYYSDSDQIDSLIEWLNPKGIREFKLRTEILKQHHFVTVGMRKRAQDLANIMRPEQIRRSTRTKSTFSTMASEPYMTYVNKLAR